MNEARKLLFVQLSTIDIFSLHLFTIQPLEKKWQITKISNTSPLFIPIYLFKSENNTQNHFSKSKIHPIICFCKIKSYKWVVAFYIQICQYFKDHVCGGAAVYFIETIEKTDMRLGISVKKRNISIYGITSTFAIHQPKAMLDNVRAVHLRCDR